MKPIASLITGISIISLIGCNNIDSKNDNVDSQETVSGIDTVETGMEPVKDSLTAAEMDTIRSTASDQSGQTEQSEGDNTYTETEVVQVDTVATEIVYDVNRKTIEQVDTVGATKTYKVERKILKKTIEVDTITEIIDKEQDVAYEEGNYQVLDEKVEKDTVTEIINNPVSDEPETQVNNQALEEDEAGTAQDTINQDITTIESQETTTIESQDTSNIESEVRYQSNEQQVNEENPDGSSD